MGKGVADNAHTYGFMLRYPKAEGHGTGYTFEARRLGYLGPELAKPARQYHLRSSTDLTKCCKCRRLLISPMPMR